MKDYQAPIEDIRFLLSDVLGFDAVMQDLGRTYVDAEFAVSLLEEAGRFVSGELFPLNRHGDEQGARLENGVVRTADGYADAYRRFVEAGWPALSASSEHGGQGLPRIVQLFFDEMISAANLSFGLFPGLTRGAVEAIEASASDELKQAYLPRMVSGTWTGAMALTESGAGTDLGLLTTRAAPLDDGSYAITGTKIFISSGDHDFGGNIVHLVLARLPDAPPGVKGISLFLVPKLLPDAEGNHVVANAMSVGALEEKMGIHAQPTCVMNYDGAKGWLVGEAHRGLAAMFIMMNAERLFVGIQGLGLADAAYQQAAAYAQERLQGRAPDGAPGAAPIIAHADVRRMLLTIRSFVEAARALAGWTALQMERAAAHPDADARGQADGLVALMTPVVKAAFTDFGFESAVLAQQVFGGHGYVREWGVEQYVRDARITQIYEGTNGVQAMDLVGRKIGLEGGTVAGGFFDMIEADLNSARTGGAGGIADATAEALARLRRATEGLIGADVNRSGAAATDYLRLFALTSFGWMWARMAATAKAKGTNPEKIAIADFFAARILPQAAGLEASIASGAETVMALDAAQF